MHSGVDIARSDREILQDRVMFVESRGLVTGPEVSGLQVLDARTPPRFVKTHLPASYYNNTLQSSKTKFIVVFRNPKDMLVTKIYSTYIKC